VGGVETDEAGMESREDEPSATSMLERVEEEEAESLDLARFNNFEARSDVFFGVAVGWWWLWAYGARLEAGAFEELRYTTATGHCGTRRAFAAASAK
jgi:hypothetical protein